MEKFLRKKLIGGNFKEVSPTRSRMMSAIKSKDNKTTEKKFFYALKQANLLGWTMHEKLVGAPDFCFPAYRIAIFLDGCFWHGCPKCGHIPKTNQSYWQAKIEKNKERDIQKAHALNELGYIVIRFWEHELRETLDDCITFIKDIIEDRLLTLKYEEWD